MVFFARDDQQRSSVGVVLELDLRPRVEIGGRGLKERNAGRRHREPLVKLSRSVLVDGARERIAELLERQCDRFNAETETEAAAKRRGIDCDRSRGEFPTGKHLRQQTAEGVSHERGFLVQPG